MANVSPLFLNSDGDIEEAASSDTLLAGVSEVDTTSKTNNTGGTITKGFVVCASTTADEVVLATGGTSALSNILGLATADITDTSAGNIQTDGVFAFSNTTEVDAALTGGSGGFTPQARVFLDVANAGKLTETVPTTASKYVVQVGIATSTTEIEISPRVIVKLNA